MEDQSVIRTQLINYVYDNDYLTHSAIAGFMGTNRSTLESFLYGTPANSSIATEAKRFLNGIGRQLADIRIGLRTGSGNRIELHQKRQQILQNCKS